VALEAAAASGARRSLGQSSADARDLERNVSRAVVDWASERQVSTLGIGDVCDVRDVRDVADGTRLHRKSQQQIGVRCVVTWPAAPGSHVQGRRCWRHRRPGRRSLEAYSL
jgi:hypothetical protein